MVLGIMFNLFEIPIALFMTEQVYYLETNVNISI